MRVLLVEDEPEMAALLQQAISAEGHVVDAVRCLDEARAAVCVADYSLIVLDRRLPDGDGLELLRDLKDPPARPAVLVLSALDAAGERVLGLNAGADDYLSKPFDVDEFRARIRATLRRSAVLTQAPIVCGQLSYRPANREFFVGDVPLRLRRRETALLATLMMRARRVVQRATLMNEAYGFLEEPTSNTLDAHMSRLRKRLAALQAEVVIHPVRGVGYVIDTAEDLNALPASSKCPGWSSDTLSDQALARPVQ